MSHNESKFWDFHKLNPHIGDRLFSILNRAFERGFISYGISAATEIVRWEDGPTVNKTDRFKINNNHRAFYSRLYQLNYPENASKVTVREQTSV